MEKMSTKELKDVVGAVIDVIDLGISVGKGGLGKDDLMTVFSAMPMLIGSIGQAVDGAHLLPAEVQDLSAEEAAELAAFVVAKISVEDEKAKLIVEKSLKLAVSGFELAKAIAAK
jgi:hypothetical protein